jgi:cytochrome c1
MFRILAFFVSLTVFAAPVFAEPPFDADAQVTVSKLRQYCAACHAIGTLRFIRSDDDQEVWQYLFVNEAPNSRKIWAEAIVEVLSWPSDIPPPFDQPMDPRGDRDWMPKGGKRLSFASDTVDGQPTRHLVLETLQKNLSERE